MLHMTPCRAAAAFAAALAIAGLAAAVPSQATSSFKIVRIAGQDRYETAASAALDAFASSTSAVIARGDAFPDALAGSYLTGVIGAPILLTRSDALPKATSDALTTLGVTKVILLGGTGAISDAVAEQAKGGTAKRTVTREAGDNRYATAAKIATDQDAAGIGTIDGDKSALLVSGETFADALAAGPLAHAEHLPILLTPAGSLAPEAADAISSLGIKHVVVVGGTAAVSAKVVTAVEAKGASTERVAGQNRYESATMFADFAQGAFTGLSDSSVDLATGEKFADALAAGPSAGSGKRPLLLTASTSLSPETAQWLSGHAGTLTSGRVYGGTGAVSDSVVSAAEAAGSGTGSGPAQGQLTFADIATNTYRFVPDGAAVGQSVTYKDTDTFLVDGASATVGGFESSVTPGDLIRHVPASGTTAARHELTNVAAASITSGTVGNVDIANHQLDIINAVNGDFIRKDILWTGVLWKVDNASAVQADFEAAINEGDDIDITGSGATTTFGLTNLDTTGVAGNIVVGSNPVLTTTDFTIGALGDDPANNTNDATYQANGDPTATDVFKVDGQPSDYKTFSADLTAGDAATYGRAAGIETFQLINRSPSLVSGQAVDDLNPQGAPLPPTPAGGSFTVVTADGPVKVTYAGGGTFVVDGNLSSETEFEAAYTAGDGIVFRGADTPSGTTQRVELTNATLAGPVGKDTVNTADAANPPGSTAPPPNSYGVLGQDGKTVLKQVTYVSATASANTYFLQGAAVTLGVFETELDAIKAGTRTGSVVVQTTGTGASAVTQHRLTTAAAAA